MYEEAVHLYSRSLICPVAGSEASDKKWQSEEREEKKKLNRPYRDRLFYFIKAFLSICLTIPPHKEFILRLWLLIKTILELKLKCKICFFFCQRFVIFFLLHMGPGLRTPTRAKFFLLFAPLLLLPHCSTFAPPLADLTPLARNTGDSECEILRLSRKKKKT